MRLTDPNIRTAIPAEKPYNLADSAGLYLEVHPYGSKYWRLKYCHAGKEKRLAVSTLHGLALAIGGSWHQDASQNRLMHSDPRRKRAWFSGLWANASEPPVIPGLADG
jgi:hypothetical protein